MARLEPCVRYADDIVLIAPTVSALQRLVTGCELVLKHLDMPINVKKSACIRFGNRAKVDCSPIVLSDGQPIGWCDSIKYLGVNFISSTSLRCCTRGTKGAFFRAFNATFGKVGRCASEVVSVELLRTKCLPILLYAAEVCPLNNSDINSLQFALSGAMMKIFQTKSVATIATCSEYFGISDVRSTILRRFEKFAKDFYSVHTGHHWVLSQI